MPVSVAGNLRQQAKECLEVAQRTTDEAVRRELLTAAAWLHEEAVRIEKLLKDGGPSGNGSGRRHRAPSKDDSSQGASARL